MCHFALFDLAIQISATRPGVSAFPLYLRRVCSFVCRSTYVIQSSYNTAIFDRHKSSFSFLTASCSVCLQCILRAHSNRVFSNSTFPEFKPETKRQVKNVLTEEIIKEADRPFNSPVLLINAEGAAAAVATAVMVNQKCCMLRNTACACGSALLCRAHLRLRGAYAYLHHHRACVHWSCDTPGM
ncbi:uncharacterized protein DEA37_0013487 [Paragonimus westermani]|uniref:Uncharacterized protein n=1 Tax=Paragonimus westermani TaxID=34504 RepID=A0A5J4NAG0_9TREM|nr:uncharacterized protein DEA37_0013487 [Paragonimus westermani]